MTRVKTIFAAATLGAMVAIPAAGSASTYQANLVELNNSGVSGTVTFMLDKVNNLLNVSARVMGLDANMPHINHIHGRFNEDGTPLQSELPKPDLDADGDGFVEVLEAAPAYGDILLSLEAGLARPSNDPSKVHSGPKADENGMVSYDLSFDLLDDSIFFSPVSGMNYEADDIFPLNLREYVIHGLFVPAGVRVDKDGNPLGAGYDATMPVAAAVIAPVPVPAAGLLLLGGLGALGAVRRRRQAAAA